MGERLVPELPVADVAATQRWDRDVLGFRIEWIWDQGYGAVSSGEARLDRPASTDSGKAQHANPRFRTLPEEP